MKDWPAVQALCLQHFTEKSEPTVIANKGFEHKRQHSNERYENGYVCRPISRLGRASFSPDLLIGNIRQAMPVWFIFICSTSFAVCVYHDDDNYVQNAEKNMDAWIKGMFCNENLICNLIMQKFLWKISHFCENHLAKRWRCSFQERCRKLVMQIDNMPRAKLYCMLLLIV